MNDQANIASASLGLPRAALLAVAVMIAVNAVFIATAESTAPIGTSTLHHLFDAGQHLALGLVAFSALAAWRRWGPNGRAAPWAALAVVMIALASLTVPPDVSQYFHRVAPLRWARVLVAVSCALMGLSVVAAAFAGHVLGRPWLRSVPVVVSLAALCINHLVLHNDYPAIHLFVALCALALLTVALSTASLPTWWRPFTRVVPWLLAGSLSAYSLLAWPGNAVLLQMLKTHGSITGHFVALLHSTQESADGKIPPGMQSWFVDRSTAAAVPASQPALIAEPPIVLLLSIDALRTDTVMSGEHDKKLPNLAWLRRRSIAFEEARSPGSGTVYSLSALFSGLTFSQLYWSRHPREPQFWPHADKRPRFPEHLAKAGIPTVTFASAFWLVNEFGIVRGFTEEEYVDAGVKYTPAATLADRIIERLKRHGNEPLFLFSHFLDSHFPYRYGSKSATPHERYVSTLAVIDRQLGRIVDALRETGLEQRTVLMVTADHGEAFGEHSTKYHATTLYEEQIRVPLLVRLPRTKGRTIDAPVTLIDLGPTVLDLFGLPTPAHFMGQSLVPALRGSRFRPTRPLVFEQRMKRAMVFSDGYKVIEDTRLHTTELYQLKTDPGEQHNLLDNDATAIGGPLSLMRLYFQIHAFKEAGYEPPYRR